jgi:hypothetical protein
MKLSDFKEQREDRQRWLAATIKDADGTATHALELIGQSVAIRRAFRESEFDVVVDHSDRQEDWEEAARRTLEGRTQTIHPARTVRDFIKPRTPVASAQRSAFVVLRPLQASKSFYVLTAKFFVPTGFSVFFVLPWTCACFGVVMPVTGDEDLFLSLNGPFTPIVAASTLGGLSWDRVGFVGPCWPWTQFIPFFRVFGFIGGVCVFTWSGFGVP